MKSFIYNYVFGIFYVLVFVALFGIIFPWLISIDDTIIVIISIGLMILVLMVTYEYIKGYTNYLKQKKEYDEKNI